MIKYTPMCSSWNHGMKSRQKMKICFAVGCQGTTWNESAARNNQRQVTGVQICKVPIIALNCLIHFCIFWCMKISNWCVFSLTKIPEAEQGILFGTLVSHFSYCRKVKSFSHDALGVLKRVVALGALFQMSVTLSVWKTKAFI